MTWPGKIGAADRADGTSGVQGKFTFLAGPAGAFKKARLDPVNKHCRGGETSEK